MKSFYYWIIGFSAFILLLVTYTMLFPCIFGEKSCWAFEANTLFLLILAIMFLGVVAIAFIFAMMRSKQEFEIEKLAEENKWKNERDKEDRKRFALDQQRRDAMENYVKAVDFFKLVHKEGSDIIPDTEWASAEYRQELDLIVRRHAEMIKDLVGLPASNIENDKQK